MQLSLPQEAVRIVNRNIVITERIGCSDCRNNSWPKSCRFSQPWLWRMSSSEMWRCVDSALTDVSEESITSIVRVEKSPSGGNQSDWCWVCSRLLTLVPRSWIFLPWRWRRYFSPKRRLTQDVHSATSQKTTFFKIVFYSQLWYGRYGPRTTASFPVFRHKALSAVCYYSVGTIVSLFWLLCE
jgi:hypothetical protein